MNRLSSILLSKQKKHINKFKENTNLNKRSLSRSKSPNTSNIKLTERARSSSPYMNKMPHNKFLFVSLAMISTKGPNVEDRIILRRMRMEKGGVVDLAQDERKKAKYKIKKITKKINNIDLYHTNPKYREIAAKIIQAWWKELKISFSKKLKKIILIQSAFRGKWVRKNMYDLLYLNYLYICFCRKIEKVLSNHVRPYVFDKLYLYKKGQIDSLKKLITKKEKKQKKGLMSLYLKKWYSFLKHQNKKDKLGKQLVDIRSHKENKLNILLAFFNKWRYMTKISNIPQGKNFNIYPLNKLNGLCKIMDAAKRYIQKKALCKIIKQLIKYLTEKTRQNLLNKIITRKREYIKNILRNTLYIWYSKILKFKKNLNEQEANRLREIRTKIFKILMENIIRHLKEKILRKYLIRIYSTVHIDDINKYILYEILRKINNKELIKNKEIIIEIQGVKYQIKKTKKDLIIKILDYEDEENKEQIVDDYEKILEKINKRKSGEFKEGEEIPLEIKKDLDENTHQKKKKTKKKSIEKKRSDKRRKTSPQKVRVIKRIIKKLEEKTPSQSEEEEERELSSSPEGKNIKKVIIARRRSEPVKKRRNFPIKRKYDDYEEKSDESYEEIYEEYIDNDKKHKNKKYIYVEERPKKKRYSKKRKDDYYEYEEESPHRRKNLKTKYVYIRRDSEGNEIIEEEISFSSGEELPRKKKIKTKGKSYNKKIKTYENNYKIEEVGESEEIESESQKEKLKELYDEEGRHLIDIDKKRKSFDLFDENGKKILDLNKYINKDSEIEIPIYDKDKRRVIDSKKCKNKKGEFLIDLYDKKGKRIKDIKKYEIIEEKSEEEFEEEEKEENKSIDEKEKEKEKEEEPLIDLYDKNGEKIKDLERHLSKDGYFINLYDKNGNKILDLQRYENKNGNYNINIYDKEGKKINNPQKYKRKNGSFKIDLFDKEGRKLLDLKALSKRKTLQLGKSKYYENLKGNDKDNKKMLDLKKDKED